MEKKGILSRLFGGKAPAAPIEAAAEGVVKLERQLDAKRNELDRARQELQQKYQDELLDGGTPGNHRSQAGEIVALQAQVDGLVDLVRQARQEALALIAAESPKFAERVSSLESERLEIRKRMDAERTEAAARAARKLEQKLTWPGPNTGGALGIPATTLSEQEFDAIVGLVRAEDWPADPNHVEYDRLNSELTDLAVFQRSQPDLALEHLLDRYRRAA